MDLEFVKQSAKEIFPVAQAARRHLHKNPELSGAEYKTQEYIMQFLDNEGIQNKKIADTGVVGIIEGSEKGRVVAIRGDMDALCFDEVSNAPYASQNDGVMHACGHDAHVAINLGLAKFFSANKDKFKGTIKLFFQPAEEDIGGAKRMIEEGCMQNPDVDFVTGLHVTPSLNYDQIAVRYNTVNVSTDNVTIEVLGKSAHGAYPDTGVDAIVIAANIISTMQTIVARNLSPLESGVVTFGVINGGTARNILANKVVMQATVRSATMKIREMMFKRIEEIAKGIAKAMGGDAVVTFGKDSYIPLVNHAEVVDLILETAGTVLGKENIFSPEHPSMGGEDFAFFVKESKGAFYALGCRMQDKEEYPLHSSSFDIDERCLETGIVLQAQIALNLLNS